MDKEKEIIMARVGLLPNETKVCTSGE